MTRDPLLSDDLAALFRSFPNDALRDLVAVLKQYTSFSPFPANRAYDAHTLPADGNFIAHADAIAAEVLWWGSHDVHRQVGDLPGWISVLLGTARSILVYRRASVGLRSRLGRSKMPFFARR